MIELYTDSEKTEKEKIPKHLKSLVDERFIKRVLKEALPAKLIADLLPRRVLKVLIVEDDMDTMSIVAKVFQKFNCEIMTSNSVDSAYMSINKKVPDVIVLDWHLNEDSGQDLIKLCEQKIERFQDMHQVFSSLPPKVITFTGVSQPKLQINGNKYFKHFDHWAKPLKYKDIVNKTADLIEQVEF